jgi:hypothetical protein
MFYPVEGGSVYEIHDNAFGYIFKCNLPPVGYGIDVNTGELRETDVIKRSNDPEECFWERFILPSDWKQRRRSEKERQKFDKFYFDPELEAIRQREWKRRRCGIWFHNYNPKTKKVDILYITGTHYLYATYWKFQGKHMDFRINDMECWYVVRYIETDPNALGLNEITKRKLGKTARLGCWIYERTSRMKNAHAGLQSKTDNDAWEVFKKAIVHPWKSLPDYFRPTYDTNKGDDPNDELRFFNPSKRGSNIDDEDQEEALESWIDFGASGESVYDGPELDTYGSDESGKTKKPVSIKERQSTVRFCSEIDGEFKHRKQWYTTTVEIDPDDDDNYEFQELTAMSNPLERDDNGRTMSGLYTYFLPAYKGMYFDKYGYPDEERAKVYLLNTRKKLEEEGKLRELSSFKRKNPMNFKESFSVDGSTSLYNPELLNEQLDLLNWNNKLTERGNLKWYKDSPFIIEVTKENGETTWELNKVIWEENPNGKFEKVAGWWPREPNMVYENNGQYLPNNNHAFRIGYDTFKYDKTKNKRRSNAAAFGFQIKDDLFPSEYDDMFVLRYSFRPESRRLANMDVLMMGWLLGCQMLIERNAGDHYKEHYTEWGCAGFMMWMPGEIEPGINTTGSTTDMICNYTEQYINEHIKKVFFKNLIKKETGWLGFKVEDTEKFDEPMSAGITLIAVKGKKYRKVSESTRNIENILPYRKVV